jgi:hypothetical protein
VSLAAQLHAQYPDFDEWHLETIEFVHSHTMTSPERIHALIEAIIYIVRRRIPGTIVECGVWRGGSIMAAARTLQALSATDRNLYLFDTFEGMSTPTNIDVDIHGQHASQLLTKTSRDDQESIRCYASLEEVKSSIGTLGYPAQRIHYVRGKIEDTVPKHAPSEIAVLRLDTDWYESTKHELNHLYPRLSSGGVLIIDDYGHWRGSRRATDEFIAATPNFGLLIRVDYTGRVAIKA